MMAGAGYLLPQPGQNVAMQFPDYIVAAGGRIGNESAVEFNNRQTEAQVGQQANHGGDTACAGHGKEQPLIQHGIEGILAIL